MNAWAKWATILMAGVLMIAGHMLFVADGRYFFRSEAVKFVKEMVVFAERQKTSTEIQKENYKAIKKLNEKQTDFTEQWLRDKNERQETLNDRLKERIRELQSRPRAQ